MAWRLHSSPTAIEQNERLDRLNSERKRLGRADVGSHSRFKADDEWLSHADLRCRDLLSPFLAPPAGKGLAAGIDEFIQTLGVDSNLAAQAHNSGH